MKTQQVFRRFFVVNTQNQGVALARLIGKKNFDRVVDVAALDKLLQLPPARALEQAQRFCRFGQRHVAVTLLPQKLFHHFKSVRQL